MRRTIVSRKWSLATHPDVATHSNAPVARHSNAWSRTCENASKRLLPFVLALVALAPPAQGADDAPALATTLIPVVASVHGLSGVEWRTDVLLKNENAAEVDVVLSLPTAPGQPFMLTSLAGGESISLSDIVQQTFGQTETISPLLIQTSGARPVTASAVIFPIAAGQPGTGEIIPAFYGQPLAGVSQISTLRLNGNYRTNIGFVNLGSSDALFTVALQRLEDRNMAIASITVPAGGLAQMPLQTLFPLITDGDDFEVIADCDADQTYAYASIIRNDTNEAIFAEPLPVGFEP